MPEHRQKFGLPNKENMGVKKKIGFEKVKLERNADNSGRTFLGGGLKPWEKKFADKIHHQNSLRNSPAIFPKFARPKISPQIRSAEPGAQEISRKKRLNENNPTIAFRLSLTLFVAILFFVCRKPSIEMPNNNLSLVF